MSVTHEHTYTNIISQLVTINRTARYTTLGIQCYHGYWVSDKHAPPGSSSLVRGTYHVTIATFSKKLYEFIRCTKTILKVWTVKSNTELGQCLGSLDFFIDLFFLGWGVGWGGFPLPENTAWSSPTTARLYSVIAPSWYTTTCIVSSLCS